MKFFTLTSILGTAAAALAAPSAPAAVHTASLTYSGQYDNPKMNLNGVACSNGANGLESKGFKTLGQLPGFPNVGGTFEVAGWNSSNCGTCWKLTYQDASINVLAVDHSAEGTFNIGLTAMNKLTHGHAVDLGRITVQYHQVPTSQCH